MVNAVPEFLSALLRNSCLTTPAVMVKELVKEPVLVHLGVFTVTLTCVVLDVVINSSSCLLEAEFCPKVTINSVPLLSGAPV